MSEASRRRRRAARIEQLPVAWPRHATWVTLGVCLVVGVSAYVLISAAAPQLFEPPNDGPPRVDAGTDLVALIVVASVTPLFLFWWRQAVRERSEAADRARRGLP